jgi:archaellum component FlaC
MCFIAIATIVVFKRLCGMERNKNVKDVMDVAEKIADHINRFEAEVTEQTSKLETNIGKLEKEIDELKKKSLS